MLGCENHQKTIDSIGFVESCGSAIRNRNLFTAFFLRETYLKSPSAKPFLVFQFWKAFWKSEVRFCLKLCESHYLLLWALNTATQSQGFSGVTLQNRLWGRPSAALERLLQTVVWGWGHSRFCSHSMKKCKWISVLSVLCKPIMKTILWKKLEKQALCFESSTLCSQQC